MAGEMPIGKQDFKEIRDKDNLYIDKSDMIPHILSEGAKVYLYTRPRRFGKSLNLSMLDAFFNIKYPKDNTWFDGLKVSECGWCQKHKNAYPVIYFDFKELSAHTPDTFYTDIVDMMSELYRCHKYLLESGNLDDVDRGYFKKVLCGELDHLRLRKAIHRLSRMLCEHHGRKVIILLDEYDNPINNSYGKPFHQDVIDVMRDMLSSALKGNESLEFGVITGVMQIAKESIFSGLNSLRVNNVLSEDFDESFGFTDGEVRSILEDNGHPGKYREAKEWYDGYRFGNTHVYNPWSILNYVESNFKPQAYWAGTSGNDILRTLIDGADDSVFDDLLSLSQGMSIRKRLDTTVTMRDLEHDDNAIFSLMVMSGYLTAVEQDGGHMLLIPNGEMYRVFGDMIGIHLNRRCGNSRCGLLIHDLSRAILRNDPKAIESNLYDLLATVIGSNMLTHEHVYQGFLVGLLMHLSGKYRVTAEMENGKGRYDIMLRSKSSENPNIIMELKRSDSESSLQHDAEQALSQIMERDYIHGLKGDILLYGIAFHGKEPRIVSEMIRQNR